MTYTGDSAEQFSNLRHTQSPIPILLDHCVKLSALDPLQFYSYSNNEGYGSLLNNGKTARYKLNTEVRPVLSGGPLLNEYTFEHLHFHWSTDDYSGSEHIVDGLGYAAEGHCVHYNSLYKSLNEARKKPDGLTVVAYLIEAVDEDNPYFDMLAKGFGAIAKSGCSVELGPESLSWMDSCDVTDANYFAYQGSLTSPPYSENVTWILFENPVQISGEQMEKLRQLEKPDGTLIENNVRAIQQPAKCHPVMYVEQSSSKLQDS